MYDHVRAATSGMAIKVSLHSSSLHRHARTQRTKDVRCPLIGYVLPGQLRLGPLCATSGNAGPSARQTPEARPSTRRSNDWLFPSAVVWAPEVPLVPQWN